MLKTFEMWLCPSSTLKEGSIPFGTDFLRYAFRKRTLASTISLLPQWFNVQLAYSLEIK